MANVDFQHKDLEILIHAPTRKDSEVTAQVLRKAGYTAQICGGIDELIERFDNVTGAILLSEESLSARDIVRLGDRLKTQPPWSDVPIIVIASSGGSFASTNDRLEHALTILQNTTVFEKPVRLSTLLSVIRSILTARSRQYQLRALLEELQQSKAHAEEASRMKSSFLANMSHEIRTPLGAVIGFTDLMRDPNLSTEERIQYSDIIARNGRQLSNLINDILDLSKVEAGKLDLEQVTFSIHSAIEDVTNLLRPLAE